MNILIGNYLKGFNGIINFSSLSLLLFFLFFAGMIIYVMRLNKSYVSEMSNMPLDDNSDNYSTN